MARIRDGRRASSTSWPRTARGRRSSSSAGGPLQPEGLRPRSAEAQAEYVVTRVSPGAIVDLHDAEGVAGAPARLVAALGTMLNGLRDAGYRLTTVAELLGDARAARGRE